MTSVTVTVSGGGRGSSAPRTHGERRRCRRGPGGRSRSRGPAASTSSRSGRRKTYDHEAASPTSRSASSSCSCSTVNDSAGSNQGPKAGARPRPSAARRSSPPTSSLSRRDHGACSSRTFQMMPRCPPGRTTLAISRERALRVEPVERLAGDDRVDSRVLDRDVLRAAARRPAREGLLGDRAHAVVRLHREHVVAEAREQHRESPGAGPEVEHACRRLSADQPGRSPWRVAGPEAVVGVRARPERQPAVRPRRLAGPTLLTNPQRYARRTSLGSLAAHDRRPRQHAAGGGRRHAPGRRRPPRADAGAAGQARGDARRGHRAVHARLAAHPHPRRGAQQRTRTWRPAPRPATRSASWAG